MPVDYELQAEVAILTLNEPERRNALSRELVVGLRRNLERSRTDAARAVVINSQGTAFCAGANIDDLASGWMGSSDPDTDPTRLFGELAREPRITVAAVQGIAAGGGFELSLACDLVVAGPKAAFVCPELGHGVIPPTALALLARTVGRRRALDLILTRRKIEAQEAVDLGLVNIAVDGDNVVEAAVELARSIVRSTPPGALAVAKRYFSEYQHVDWNRVLESSAEVPKAEWQEGLESFAQKRRPDYEPFWVAAAAAWENGR
ncbi:MAG: enoyl-CoA hydratase/isomerase family protein [Mesorhizobium sp.]